MRKYRAWILIALFTLIPGGTFAQSAWGLGVILGEPTGISFKQWTGRDRAFDAAAAWSFSGLDSFQFHGDYLFHNFSWQEETDIRGVVPLYYGIGARIKLGSNDNGRLRNRTDTRIGVRIPGGISYLLEDAPVELFLEIVPLLDVVPDTRFDLNGAIGARYYFR